MLKQNCPCGIIHQREYLQHKEQAFTGENTQFCSKLSIFVSFMQIIVGIFSCQKLGRVRMFIKGIKMRSGCEVKSRLTSEENHK